MFRKVRITSQILCLLFVVAVPFLSYLNTLRQVYGIKGFHMAEMSGGWMVGKLYAFYERTFGLLDEPVALIDSVKGAFWSITIFGLNISDPLAALDYVLATREIHAPLLISILIPVLFTVVFGRAFCGWICPINTLSEWIDGARRILIRLFPFIPNVKMGLGTKYWVLAGTIIIAAAGGIPLFASYLPYLILGRELHNVFLFQVIGFGAYILMMLALIELLISKRAWCRYLCPSGALLSILGTYSMVRIAKNDSVDCAESCFECDNICPMALDIKNGNPGRECSQCGDCMAVCPQYIIELKALPGRVGAMAVIVIALMTLFLTVPASAHHMGGIPHYGYTENYPQVPLTEQRVEQGEQVVSLTTIFFQGIDQELSDIPFDTQFYVHIQNKSLAKNEGSAGDEGVVEPEGFVDPFDKNAVEKARIKKKVEHSYTGKLVLAIFSNNDQKVGEYTLDAPAEESIYRFRHYFAGAGDYKIKVHYYPASGQREASFSVTIEAPKEFNWIVTVGIVLFFCFVGFLLLNKGNKPRIKRASPKSRKANK